MSESSLPSNSSQPDPGVLHSANADAIERQSLYDREETIQRLLAEQPITTAEAFAAIDPQRLTSQAGLAGDGAPQPEDLVVLIQALNQCNSNLLARVSELEEELAKRQAEKAQKAQPSPSEDPALRAELNTVKQKVMKLRQQMNTAHQANQSQRACIQALRQNLADAEQKHATLADAHVQLQTQFQEQSQRLAEAENTCRDLCLRLHRQQQYTLQFKAALKARARAENLSNENREPAASSVFEVTSPSTVTEIRPWSAQRTVEGATASMQETAPVLPVEAEPVDSGDRPPAVTESFPFIEVAILPNPDAPDALVSPSDEVGDRPTATPSEQNPMPLDLPAFPSIQQLSAIAEVTPDAPTPDAQPDIPSASEAGAVANPGSRPLAPISFDMKQGLPKWAKFTHMPLPTEADPVPEAPSPTVQISDPIVADQSSVEPIIDPWTTTEAAMTPELVAPESAALPSRPDGGAPPLGMGHEAPTPEIDLDPVLLEQLDAAVRPLLDSVVDAIRGSEPSVPSEAVGPLEAIAPDQVPLSPAPAEAMPPALPRKPDLDRAEEDLWRDLAKLVNISTDDIIQASLSGDFDAFTSIDFDALRQSLKEGKIVNAPMGNSAEATLVERPSVEPTPVPAAPPALTTAPAGSVPSPSSSIRPFQDGLDLPFYNVRQEPLDDHTPEETPAMERSPSPVVYPDRAPRKLPSIAAIDLPSFPRPQPG